MSIQFTKEKRFEEDIESYLLSEGGYIKGGQATYDKSRAIDMLLLTTFIENTQPKSWERYRKIYGESAQSQLYKRFQQEVDSKGLVHVLRNGFKDRGIDIKVCYFMPPSSINSDAVDKYNSNIMTCNRQFYYSSICRNSIDMVLSINGIPVVAIELKNQLTGQDVNDAKTQFMNDRDSKEMIFRFNNRVLVNFFCDLYEVWMATKLAGEKTFFLPFNQGSNGAGKVGDGGNPANSEGYVTDYLWKKVLSKDNLMAILHKYINVEIEETVKIVGGSRTTVKSAPKLIFPRYHQLDVVESLTADVMARGTGHNYLIQHSAGSRKSNSIAWLAYKLSVLHNQDNEDVYNTVFIVTDRRVLNRQLQGTLLGFDHKDGQVAIVTDKDKSDVLKTAIDDGKRIVVTTLHRFPVIFSEIGSQAGKRFAVIVDEAHSSQTGNSAKKLKTVLADVSNTYAELAEIEGVAVEEIDDLDVVTRELVTQGKHDNLSFFAFTATPKPKTLEMFGVPQENGEYDAFHHYSMRQAISEGFILDVLKYYNTMENTWQIAKNVSDNPEYEETPAITAIKRYHKTHKQVLNQKVKVIVEQFRQVTLSKMSGQAKAMVVAPSRIHAVLYYQAIKKYAADMGYLDVLPLVLSLVL